MLSKISASDNYGDAENFEFFFPMLTKFSTSANYGDAEDCEFVFSMANQNFHLSQVWWCRNF
jgi:hypothetical protein